MRLTIESLKQAGMCCFLNVLLDCWTISMASEFLRANGISPTTSGNKRGIGRKLFIDRALSFKELQHDANSFKTDEHMEFPPFWVSGVDLLRALFVAMHGTPLGV